MEIRKILVFATALLTGIGVWPQSFTEREVQLQIVQEYEHDTMQLAGTLTMPVGVTEKVPAVIPSPVIGAST